MNWLITGGCGFIGTSLIRELLEDGGHRIRVIDNLSVGTRNDLKAVAAFVESNSLNLGDGFAFKELPPRTVELIVGDILDDVLAIRVSQEADVVVHLAANTGVAPSVEDPRKDCETNVIGTLNYLQAARLCKVKRFVFASSGAPVGECTPPIHEEIPPHPVSPYGASKLAGEGYCSAFFRTYGVETVALRFGNVYGPGSTHKPSVVARFIKQALAGEAWEIYGSGRQTRDFIFIADLVRAIRLAASKEAVGGEIFQIATSAETSVIDLARQLRIILKEVGGPEVPIHHAESRIGDVLRNFSDTTKAQLRLGWRAQTSLSQGLRLTVEWFLHRHGEDAALF